MNATDYAYSNKPEGDARRGNWMQTYTGQAFYPLDPRPEEISIIDIAHALGKLCRFNGHCRWFYSVAQHSILVSQIVPAEDALAGLLHDATEAYLGDVIRPLKPHLSGYKEIEHAVWLAVAKKFDLAPELPVSVKQADNAVLLREAEIIMQPPPQAWSVPGDAAAVEIACMDAMEATTRFLHRFHDLSAGQINQKGSILS